MLKKAPVFFVVAVLVIITVIVTSRLRSREEAWRPLEQSEIDCPEDLDDLHVELQTLNSEEWVRTSLPDESSRGVNLSLYRRRVPILFDMNGQILHSWPKVRASGRVRLSNEGKLIIIGTDNLIKEYDWHGNLLWYFQLPTEGDIPHHDLIRLANGNVLVLALANATVTDYLWEVDAQKNVVWEWRIDDHQDEFPNWDNDNPDPSHCNSIRELPSNRWFDEGDHRFRPGNILVSSRNLNTIFIIDKVTGAIVWKFSQGLDRQHEAVMHERDHRGAGLITIFNNGLDNLHAYRRSLVQTINPANKEVTFEYGSELFFSAVGGTAQPLPEENFLITSSNSGRAFEITPNTKIVWEWVPPYNPMRMERLRHDHCPQLAVTAPSTVTTGARQAKEPYVDSGLYRFEFSFNTEERIVEGRRVRLIQSDRECRRLLIPPQAFVRTGFGIDREALGNRPLRARFTMTIAGDGPPSTLVDTTVDSNDTKVWIRKAIPLEDYKSEYVEMCIATELEHAEEPDDPIRRALWSNPIIDSRSQHPPRPPSNRQLSEQERTLRDQQLKALGYIN